MPNAPELSTPAAFSALDEALEAPDVQLSATLRMPGSNLSSEALPYWLVNVPPADRPTHCPGFLRDICQKNIEILSTPDEQYRRQPWELVKEIVRK